MEGHWGTFQGNFVVVRSLTFVSNRRAYGPFGRPEGVPFALPAAGGGILAFHARSGRHLDPIVTYVLVEHANDTDRRTEQRLTPVFGVFS